MVYMNSTSKIAAQVTENLMAVFAGQTVSMEAVLAQMDMVYAMANKRPGMRSYFIIEDMIEKLGVTSNYSGPNYTGTKFHTFPAN